MNGGYPKFDGRCDELKGYVYDLNGSRSADIFTKTTKEVADYVAKNYGCGGDIRLAVLNLELPVLEQPEDLADGATATEKRIWEKEIDEYVKEKAKLKQNVKALYSLVWGQCSDAMRAKLEGQQGHEAMSKRADGIGLLKAIKSIVYNFQDQKYLPEALFEANRRFYSCNQGKDSAQDYHTQFQNTVDVIEHCGGQIGNDPGIVAAVARDLGHTDLSTIDPAEYSKVTKLAKERYLAVGFLLGADKSRFGKLIEDLENDFTQKQDKWPKDLNAAYHLLVNWKQDIRNMVRLTAHAANDGINFHQNGEASGTALTTNGAKKEVKTGGEKAAKDKSRIRCFECNEYGHYSSECPRKIAVLTFRKLSSCL